MKRSVSTVLTLLLSVGLFACSKSDSATGPVTVSGTYHGQAADETGSGLLTLALSQSGSTVSGIATGASPTGVTAFTGTVSGTLSGSTLTFTITITTTSPPCTIVISGTATNVTSSTLAGTYTSTSSCGNPVADGTFTLNKQ